MAITKIEDTRVCALNDRRPREGGDYVLYWMQQSQRAEHNTALEHATRRANQHGKPLLVGFGLMYDYPEANARHYRCMLEGLAEVASALARHGEDPSDPDALLAQLKVDRSIAPVDIFRGGTGAAKRVFRRFLDKRFSSYQANRNQPQTDDVSHMSKYLHFGQISPVRLALEVRAATPESNKNRDAFIEELVA